jgi:hypothetical protein
MFRRARIDWRVVKPLHELHTAQRDQSHEYSTRSTIRELVSHI